MSENSRRDLRQSAREIVERTRREQGLPETVSDPLVVRKVARIVRPPEAPGRTSQVHASDCGVPLAS